MTNAIPLKKKEPDRLLVIEADTAKERKDGSKVLILHNWVGEVIDQNEKIAFDLFPFWSTENFVSAQFIQKSDSSILLIGIMNDGKTVEHPYTKEQFLNTQKNHFAPLNTEYKVSRDTNVVWDSKKQVRLSEIKSAEHSDHILHIVLLVILIPIVLYLLFAAIVNR